MRKKPAGKLVPRDIFGAQRPNRRVTRNQMGNFMKRVLARDPVRALSAKEMAEEVDKVCFCKYINESSNDSFLYFHNLLMENHVKYDRGNQTSMAVEQMSLMQMSLPALKRFISDPLFDVLKVGFERQDVDWLIMFIEELVRTKNVTYMAINIQIVFNSIFRLIIACLRSWRPKPHIAIPGIHEMPFHGATLPLDDILQQSAKPAHVMTSQKQETMKEQQSG